MTEHHAEAEHLGHNWDALLAVAAELDRWVATMPVWSEHSWESWADHSRHHGKKEQELARRLGRMPGCAITRAKSGSAVTLRLAGVEVRSHSGLVGACKDWVALVRKSALRKPPTDRSRS